MKVNLDNIILNRLDILVKYLYIKGFVENKNKDFYTKLYKKHIQLYNWWVEDNKESVNDFIKSFNNLIFSFKRNWFDTNYKIPINKNWFILNWAHRLACCLYFWVKPIFQVVENNDNLIWWFDWFKNNFSRDEFLFLLWELDKFIELDVILLWNSYFDKFNFLKEYLEKIWVSIIWDYDLNLDKHSFIEFINDIYSYDSVILNSHIYEKAIDLLKYKPSIKLIVLKKQKISNKKQLKEKVRRYILKKWDKIYNTFHWWDDKNEEQYIKNIIFSYENVRYLTLRTLNFDNNFLNLLKKLENFLIKNNFSKDEVCIVWSWPLWVFWLDKVSDIDLIKKDVNNSWILNEWDIDILDYQYHYTITNESIIKDSLYHFYFRGFKFIKLNLLLEVKTKWLREKDMKQVSKIRDFLNKNVQQSNFYDKVIFNIKFLKSRFLVKIVNFWINFTKKLWIYNKVSYFWRKYILRKKNL